MVKSASANLNKISNTSLRHAPQVILMAESNCQRIQKLLRLLDQQIEALTSKADTQEETSRKDLQALTRLVLSLHKDLDKYSQIVHRPTIETVSIPLPSIETENTEPSRSKKMIHELNLSQKASNDSQTQPSIASASEPSMFGDSGNDNKVAQANSSTWESGPAINIEARTKLKSQKIEMIRQEIFKRIARGSLSEREGMEMIGKME